MVKAAILALLLILSGCAIGAADPQRGVSGYAFGQAKIEVCKPATPPATESCECARIEGGSLSISTAGVMTAAIAAALAYFGIPF